jgi:exodeoxyribonuclease V alpha subunit
LKNLTIKHLFKIGYFSELDYRFAECMGRITNEADPLVLLGAAVASRFTSAGHVCADIGRIAGKPIETEDINSFNNSSGTAFRLPASTHKIMTNHQSTCTWPPFKMWVEALNKSIANKGMTGDGVRATPLVFERGRRLYLSRYWDFQQRLVNQLKYRAGSKSDDVHQEALEQGLNRLFPQPDFTIAPDLQRLAAQKAIQNRITFISGGPGTGKTATVAKIIVLLIEQYKITQRGVPRIFMAAPTGKAAARLSDSVQKVKALSGNIPFDCDDDVLDLIPTQASTLHRLLGVIRDTPSRFRHHAGNPLPADMIIVDEASMISLPLMTKLVEAARKQARLILLGDQDQLASVEVGAILGDICRVKIKDHNPLRSCIIRLKHNYRSGADIDYLAKAINAGDADLVMTISKSAEWPAVSLIEPPEKGSYDYLIEAGMERYYDAYINEPEPVLRMNLFNRFRILCAHKEGPAGVGSINMAVERILQKRTGLDPNRKWYHGRPVMITRNDYQLGLFNGDIGIIMSEAPDFSLHAIFIDEHGVMRRFAPIRLRHLETVFAMTIHKSQGSEFDHIVVILPPWPSPIVTRELLYTAVTRARLSVSVIAKEEVLRTAVLTPVQRASGLTEMLET